MNFRRLRLNERLTLMAWTALLSVTVICTAFVLAIRQYNVAVDRVAESNSVLIDYLSLSSTIHQRIHHFNDSVFQRDLANYPATTTNHDHIDAILVRVENSMVSGIELTQRHGDKDQLKNERQQLADFEVVTQLVRQMLKRGSNITALVTARNYEEAKRQLALLLSDKEFGLFESLMMQLQDSERADRRHAQASAEIGFAIVFLYLPLATGMVFLLGLLLYRATARGLDRSLNELDSVVQAFAQGNLDCRVPRLETQELDDIGQVFNAVAARLKENIDLQKDQRLALEKMVAKRTDELRMSNEALSKSDQNRSRLLSDISHELRTPLTVIQGESELALRSENDSLEGCRSALTIIREQSLHMSRLVDDLLFVARSREGNVRLRKSVVKIDQLMHEVCTEFRAFSKDRNIRIQESLCCGEQTLSADKGRLRQVFSILVDNALRYSVTGSEIWVRTSASNGVITITVKDEGIGLSGKDLEEVFTRFYRGDLAKRKVDGSGLGLPVAKAIVSAHEGTIELVNNESRGATAIVVMPIYLEERESA